MLCAWILVLGASLVYAQEKLIFSDDFKALDTQFWKHELNLGGGGNWEFQWYMNNRSTSFVKDGVLHLQPGLTADVIGETCITTGCTIDAWGSQPADTCTGNAFYGCERASGGNNILNPIKSARLRTAESFSFRYGRMETRAKMPKGDWIWPAIWLLPAEGQYGLWPASGEIDVVESRGNSAAYPLGGINSFGSTLHWGPYYGQDGYLKTHEDTTLPSGDFSEDFHVFGLIWNSTNIITYLDTQDNVVLSVPIPPTFWARGGWSNNTYNPWSSGGPDAPFDREFYIIFNVAVGGVGGYFPDGQGNKPWSDNSQTAMADFYKAKSQWYPSWQAALATDSNSLQIDWIKVWQTPGIGATHTFRLPVKTLV